MQSEKARPLINLFSSGLYRRSRNFTLSRARIFSHPSQTETVKSPPYCRYGISPIPKDIVIYFMTAGNFSKESRKTFAAGKDARKSEALFSLGKITAKIARFFYKIGVRIYSVPNVCLASDWSYGISPIPKDLQCL